MKDFFVRTAAVMAKTWVWSLVLVLTAALAVWYFGPLLAVDDNRFWQGAAARLLTISVLFLLWGLAMVFANWRNLARRERADARCNGEQQRQAKRLAEHEQKNLRGRFRKALNVLKHSPRYGDRSVRWRNDLPWYLLLGDAGSGKTCLLQNSGQRLPIERIDLRPSRDFGATQQCEWYCAEDGVLIEAPARYLAQTDLTVDRSGWLTLLNLLKARRRVSPLNGVLVTLSMDTLLNRSEHELGILAQQVNSRLLDIQQTLHLVLPVHLVLTQADRLPGFVEFYDRLDGEEPDAVLGEHLGPAAANADSVRVRQAFETLLQRISGELIQRLHQERNTERRARMLDFPQQLAHIGERLCLYIESAFSVHRYQRANSLQGFYLASAGGRPEAGAGRSRFVQGLLRRVVFSAADLARLDSLELGRIRWRQRLFGLAALIVVGGVGLLWMQSYSVNHQNLEQLRDLAQQRPPASASTDELLVILPLLDSRLSATRVFPLQGQAGWMERAGLYQGDSSRPVLEAAYQQALQQLLSQVGQMLEAQVRSHLQDRELLLNNLRAYLMLNLRERRDPDWLAQWLARQWSVRYAGDEAVQHRLNLHMARLLEQPFVATLDDELVAQARQVLRTESLASVVYRVLREQAASLEPYRISQHLDPGLPVFSGVDHPIPGFFTQQGYRRYFTVQGARMIGTIVQDNWVLGEGTELGAMDLQRLMVELEQRYFSEYAQAWSAALGQIRLQETDAARYGVEQLANLSSAHSPLLQLLQQVRENTRFPTPTDALGPFAGSLPGETASSLNALQEGLADTARQALKRRFEPLHQLLDEQQNPGPQLNQALQSLNELHLQLAALNREGQPEKAAFQMVKRRMLGQPDALANVRNVAIRLPAPLNGWLDGLADDSWRRMLDGAYVHLNQRYQREVYGFYVEAIKHRYPFDAHGGSDVALNDFREFFKAQGVLARFFDDYLLPFVGDEGGRYKLRSLDGRSLPMSRALLDQWGKAQLVRQSFFADDLGEPQVRFTLAPYSLDPTVSRAVLRFGDEQMEYRHGPIVPMVFQWPTDAEDGRSSLVLERKSERALGIEKNTGPWSLFRLFDLMQGEPLSGRDVQLLKADIGGLRINFLLTSQRTPNPFDISAWRTFRIPEQL